MPLMHRLKSELGRRFVGSLPIEKMLPRQVAGPGSVSGIGESARKMHMTRVLVVTDAVLLRLGVVDGVVESLRAAGIEVEVYDGVLPDPTVDQVMAGVERYQKANCDGLVAVGGGSSIDCAKVIGVYVKQATPLPVMELKADAGMAPLIAVPTTHGTGSETTYAAVITDSKTQRKAIIAHPLMMPRVAVLDPELLRGLPPPISAATAMDALTHAVEGFISPWATPWSRDRARGAVQAVFANVLRAFHDGQQDVEARMALLRASFDAGACICVTNVGYVHAIAHTIGFAYHTPHGEANAMVLPHVLRFYGAAAHAPLAELARAVGLDQAEDGKKKAAKRSDAELADAFVARVETMQDEMRMTRSVPGLRAREVPRLARLALEEAHGERFSMLTEFGKFMKNVGYPTVRYMSQVDCEAIVAQLVPREQPASL